MFSDGHLVLALRRSFGVLLHELITAEIPRRGKLRELKCAILPVARPCSLSLLTFACLDAVVHIMDLSVAPWAHQLKQGA